jgi:hypothetical protein
MKTIKFIAISTLALAMPTQANTTLDVIFPSESGTTNKNLERLCSLAEQEHHGVILDKAIRFDIPTIMEAVNPGKYVMSCEVQFLGEQYLTQFSVIKFHRSEHGSYADSYDQSGFAFGIKPIKTRSSCYIPQDLTFDPNCLADFYGNNSYFLDSISGESNTQWHFDQSYSSAVGVFLLDNPYISE